MMSKERMTRGASSASKTNNNKRRLSRKGKNVIRKSIAGVLMASALVIAAVPTDMSGTAKAADQSGLNYETDKTAARNGDLIGKDGSGNAITFLTPPADSDIKYSYQVLQVDGTWSLMWKYKYYIPDNIDGNHNLGVVCGYNDYINIDTLNLETDISTEYVYVASSAYDSFIQNEINAKTFILNVSPYDEGENPGNGKPDTDYVFSYVTIKDLFPTEYSTWEQEYLTKLAEYREQDGISPSWKPNNKDDFALLQMSPLIITDSSKNALAQEAKRKYYCNNTIDSHGNSFAGCTLTEVRNNCKGVAGMPTEDVIYIVTKDGSASGNFDSNNFKIEGKIGIAAISNEAFKGVQKVGSIVVGDGISYVGDSAFEDSFISNVHFNSVTYIGNRVFKNCKYLSSVDLANKTTTIGNEAFSNCSTLTSISIPQGVNIIGFGAFSNCAVLSSVDLSGAPSITLGEYCFYNCPAITSVTFPANYDVGLGKAAFAIEAGSGSSCVMTSFTYPKLKNYESPSNGDTYGTGQRMGDLLLANRYNLSEVIMAPNFGASTDKETLPANTFAGCVDLGHVEFAEQSTMAVFDSGLFSDVSNPSLYVSGPELTSIEIEGSRFAFPRRSTWSSSSKVSDYVPYVYTTNGVDHYEVGVGDYRYELEVDEASKTAKLLRCEWIKTDDAGQLVPQTPSPLTIPGNVAGYSVKDIQNGCLDPIKDYITDLTIADNSIETIGEGVFDGSNSITSVTLGNSVKTIGAKAFADIPTLTKVTIGENIESIGTEAFSGCTSLQNVTFDSPSDYNKLNSIGTNAFKTGSSMLYFYGDIVDGYMPFEYAMGSNKINDTTSRRIAYGSGAPSNFLTIMDDNTGYVTLIDYPRYYNLDPALKSAFESNSGLSDEQLTELYSTMYLNIPSAVESIDVAKFLENSSSNLNRNNFAYVPTATKIDDLSVNNKYDVYSNEDLKDASNELCSKKYSDDGGYTPGLFSGEMYDTNEIRKYLNNTSYNESLVKGNDWILAVDMPGVKYIPDNCFDSCERLQSVIIGAECDDIGDSAFQGCSQLTTIGTNGNPKYSFDNFILYENKADGTYEINTCLPARGTNGYAQEIWVNTMNDPKLDNVSSIREGAFASCEYITKAELADTEITSVPPRTFEGCKRLTDVELPDSVRSISKQAFNTGSQALDVIIPCDTNISDEAFNKDDTVTIYTYKDCEITGNYDPIGYNKVYIKYIDNGYTITYLNEDLTVYEKIDVPQGYNSSYPEKDPVPKLAGHEKWTFSYWSFDNPNGIKNVTENRQAIAVFAPPASPSNNSASNNNANGGTNNNGNNGSNNKNNGSNSTSNNSASKNSASANTAKKYTVTVENGAGGGSYQAGKLVTITAYAQSDGKVFDKWTTSNTDVGFTNSYNISTTFIMPEHDVKVTATFKTSSSNGNNSSASGNSTVLPTNNTNGNNGGGGGNGSGTTVDVTSDAIDNNKKNLASATVAGSTDNFIVKITDSAYASAQVEQALKAKYGNDLSNIEYIAFDITLYDSTGTRKIENSDQLAVTITLPIPDDLVSYAGNNKAAAVINGAIDDKAVKFTTIDGVPCMTFTATHFSPYTIYVDKANLVYGNADITPKTGIDVAPKWFLVAGLGCMSGVMFMWKDKKKVKKTSKA